MTTCVHAARKRIFQNTLWLARNGAKKTVEKTLGITLTIDNLVQMLLENQEKWKLSSDFLINIMRNKEKEKLEIQGEGQEEQ